MKICELGFAQQFLIWACRSWLAGGSQWASADRDMRQALGDPAGRVFGQALGSFLKILHTAASRNIGMHRPCCGRVAPDEVLIVRILADCGGEDSGPARSRLKNLLPPTAARVAADYGGAVVQSLSACGFPLRPDKPFDGARESGRFVHSVPRRLQ